MPTNQSGEGIIRVTRESLCKLCELCKVKSKTLKQHLKYHSSKEYITYNVGNKGRSVQIEITMTIRSWNNTFSIFNSTVFAIISITNLEWLPSTKKEDDEDPTLEGNEGARNSSSNGLPPGNL